MLWHLSCLHFPIEKQRNVSVGYNSVRFCAARRWFFSDSLWKKSGLWSPTRAETVLPIPSHDLGKNLVQEIRKNNKDKSFICYEAGCLYFPVISYSLPPSMHHQSQGIFHTSQMLQFQYSNTSRLRKALKPSYSPTLVQRMVLQLLAQRARHCLRDSHLILADGSPSPK